MAQLYANNAESTLASGIDNDDTSITVQTGHGARFPSPSGGDYFLLTLTQASAETSWEIVKCTARSSDTLTIVRAQDGTSAASWSSGAKAELRLVASTLTRHEALGTGSTGSGTYLATGTTTYTDNPHPTSDTTVKANDGVTPLSVSFLLAMPTKVVLRFNARFLKSGGSARVNFYDNDVQVSIQNTSVNEGWYSSTALPGYTNLKDFSVAAVVELPAGAHTIDVRHQAADNTNQVSWYDRALMVEVPGFASSTAANDLLIALSDEFTAITAGTGKVTFRAPRSMTLSEVRASLTAGSTSGVVTVDINKNGSTILSTKLTIDQGEKTSVTAATPSVLTDTLIAADDELTFDIDTAGANAVGLKVTLVSNSPATSLPWARTFLFSGV